MLRLRQGGFGGVVSRLMQNGWGENRGDRSAGGYSWKEGDPGSSAGMLRIRQGRIGG